MLDIYQMLLATYAAVDQPMSDLAIRAIAADLSQYEETAVGTALTRCRKELRRIALADIIERIPGEHPGPEEAWAIVRKAINDEVVSFAWTDEMSKAYGVASNLADDLVAARMAFKETYQRAVSESRAKGNRPRWTASLGFDPSGREQAQKQARQLCLASETAVKQLQHFTS